MATRFNDIDPPPEPDEEVDRELPDESDIDDDDQPDIVPCPRCRKPISEDAVQCPHCREYVEDEPGPKSMWSMLILIVIIAMTALGMLAWLIA